MAWWDLLRNFLYNSILKKPGEENGNNDISGRIGLRRGAVDWLYYFLGVFTNLYGVALTLLFFLQRGGEFLVFVRALDALQEPYLGGLGVYVILKEIRKRRRREPSRHRGEYFVILWAALLVLSSALVLVSPQYHFDDVYRLIVTNSLATLIIYVGGLLNRP